MSEHLITAFDIKSVADEGTFEGLASTWDVDLDGDRIVKGAFAEAIKAPAAIKLLWQHDSREPIGVWEALRETGAGLEAKGRLLLDVQRGREAHALMRAGALNGLSIGFRIPEGGAEIDKATRVRVIKRIELREISPVTFPANEGARVTRVKAADITDERSFEAFLREAGFPRDFAKAVISRGYRAASQREAEGDQLKELAASLTHAVATLTDKVKS